MKIAKLFVIVLCAIVIASCRSHKNAMSDSSNPLAESFTSQKAVEMVNANRVTEQTVTSRISFNAIAGSQKVSVGGSLKMKRDDVIQLSLVAMGIFEAGRLELTQDYLMIVDRMGHKYVKVNYKDVEFLRNAGVDFFTFQSLFWNELFVPGDKGAVPTGEHFTKDIVNNDIRLSNNDSRYATISFLANALNGLIKETNISAKQNTGTPLFQWQYQEFDKLGTQAFPSKMKILINGSKPLEATLSLSHIKNDNDWETRTNLSSRYTEVPIEVIIKKIMTMTL